MQDCYAGDIGDFGKYGLLRWLCGMFDDDDPLSLGVLWYYTPNEDNNDGGNTSYLHEPLRVQFRSCDKELFDVLRRIVCCSERLIAAVEKSGVLPDAVFFREQLIFAPREPKQKKKQKRCQWIKEGLDAIAGVDIVFFDPDNGLEVPSVQRFDSAKRKQGTKYTYYDDLIRHWERGSSLVIYQHSARTWKGERASFDNQIEGRKKEIQNAIKGSKSIYALRFAGRAFFIVPHPRAKHADLLQRRVRSFIHDDSPWHGQFQLT